VLTAVAGGLHSIEIRDCTASGAEPPRRRGVDRDMARSMLMARAGAITTRTVPVKPTKPNSKLSLRTETIMPLQSSELDQVHGGISPATSSVWCFRASYAAATSSQNCAQKAGETIAKTVDWTKKIFHR
jgi:hypothetical protein